LKEQKVPPQHEEEKKYRNPASSIDIIVRKGNQILLERRAREPFAGLRALPGGHVDYGETVEHTALRELKEETSIEAKLVGILGVYSDPNRDPRGQHVTVVFIADWIDGNPVGGDDAQSAEWLSESELQTPKFDLAFDHRLLLRDYFEWKKYPTETFWSSKQRDD
jgi:ADP-ribose pyrophosphatase YjhB (NUDIX family)